MVTQDGLFTVISIHFTA